MKIPEDRLGIITRQLRAEIDASISAKGDLPSVWAEIRRMKQGRVSDSQTQIIKGMTCLNFPLYRPKRNLVVDGTCAAITSLNPYVQGIDPSDGGGNVDFVEDTLMNMAALADFTTVLKDAVGWAIDTNLGTMCVRPITDDNGNVVGVKSESITPMHMIGFPCGFQKYSDLKTVGHCYYDLVYRVRQKCEDGVYDCDPDIIKGGADPKETSLSSIGASNSDENYDSSRLDMLDSYVRLYDVVTEIDVKGDRKRKKYSITYDYDDNVILSVDPFGAEGDDGKVEPYPCWYFPFRLTWESDEGLWPVDSVARPVLGLQAAYNLNMNTIQQGGLFTAFGFHVVSAGAFKTKFLDMMPGGLLEAAGDFKVDSIEFPFNPESLQFVNNEIKTIVDTLLGRTQLGTGQPIAASTSATAVNALQSAQADAKDGNIDAISPSVAAVWNQYYTYLKLHYRSLKKALPRQIAIPDGYDSIKDLELKFEVTGQSAASNPQGLLAKLQAIMGMLTTPAMLPSDSPYDINKIHEKIIEALDLPSGKTLSSMRPCWRINWAWKKQLPVRRGGASRAGRGFRPRRE